MTATIDKLVDAIQAERVRRGGEGRRVFLDFDSPTDVRYDLTAREAVGFLRFEKNQAALRQRLGAESVEYHPSKYQRASGGGHDVGFVQYRERPGRRDPASVRVKFREGLESSPRHATKKTRAQLDREIAAALTGETTRTANDDGVFYLTDTKERPLGPEFSSRGAAKRAAMKLVREGAHPRVEVWHRWRGDRYMQGQASDEGWSDV